MKKHRPRLSGTAPGHGGGQDRHPAGRAGHKPPLTQRKAVPFRDLELHALDAFLAGAQVVLGRQIALPVVILPPRLIQYAQPAGDEDGLHPGVSTEDERELPLLLHGIGDRDGQMIVGPFPLRLGHAGLRSRPALLELQVGVETDFAIGGTQREGGVVQGGG